MDTAQKIRPILLATYGKTAMVDDLVVHLSEEIDAYPNGVRGGYRSREETIMLICWDWMTGGTTADSVAKKIEAVL